MKKPYMVIFEGDPDGSTRYLMMSEATEERWIDPTYNKNNIVVKSGRTVLVKTRWSRFITDAQHFATEKEAELAAFNVAVTAPAAYFGNIYVYKKTGRKPFLKLLRREAERKNVGRWPNSSGRNRRANV